MKKTTITTLITTLLLTTTTTQTHADQLKLHIDFQNTNGTTVTDATNSGITCTLKNEATVTQLGNINVLNLGNGTGYLDLTAATGTLFASLDTFTISMYYYVDTDATITQAGNFLWSFSTSTACTSTAGKYSAYRINAQRFAVSTGGYSNEYAIEEGNASEQGCWKHVLYTQNGTTGRLYIDGQRIGTNTSIPTNTSNFTTTPSYAWIGRPPFSSDSYLTNTYVADIRLYNTVLSDDTIETLSTYTDTLEYQMRYGEGPGDFSQLIQAITQAQTYITANTNNHTEAALTICQDQINMAQALVDEGLVGQTLIDQQETTLTEALETLKATAGYTFDTTNIVDGYDTLRGFRHPGALHTQEDFDRIKKQLNDGKAIVVNAHNILINADYAQSTAATYPVETIIRGGSSGENYINAARGATIAYQNALRWKIDSTEACAKHGVEVLMNWARTTTGIGGDSNYALAAGLYGYQFANAAELLRDYDGWDAQDFQEFKQWMLNIWYPSCIGFLRARNGTWENSSTWWQCPGHYWSNWGLCNVLALLSIGVLCDDVYIYNQGLSFFKHDQVGTFEDPRTANPILNDGLNEFLGNLVVTTTQSDLETGAYGKLGQMQESGRDIGHATMAAGLAVDVAHLGYNQGDDLFAYMDNRLAAGIEYVAAQTQSIEGLPWTNYHYATTGYYYTDSRSTLYTEPVLGSQIRPYWGTVIGHYEGIKGVDMPYSKMAYTDMGIDGGGTGSTSGGYDHLGYSVLLNTREKATTDQIPTTLTPNIQYNGQTLQQAELGGLVNTYQNTTTNTVTPGTIITLSPQLPDSVTDTGLWQWNTGQTTREITFAADNSGVWRVEYTNQNGVTSQQAFTIAVEGDCNETQLTTTITTQNQTINGTQVKVLYGNPVTLTINAAAGWGYYYWENGETTNTITLPNVTTTRDITAMFIGSGGRKQTATFHIDVVTCRQDITVDNTTYQDTTTVIVEQGANITLTLTPSDYPAGGTFLWDDGTTNPTLNIQNIQTSNTYTADYTVDGQTTTHTYKIYVADTEYRTYQPGNYYIRHIDTDTYLTNHGDDQEPTFTTLDTDNPTTQQWYITNTSTGTTYSFCSLLDGKYLLQTGKMGTSTTKRFRFLGPVGQDNVAILRTTSSTKYYWTIDQQGQIDPTTTTTLTDYPFQLIEAETTHITNTQTHNTTTPVSTVYYTIGGIQHTKPTPGLNIRRTTYSDGTTQQEKVFIK